MQAKTIKGNTSAEIELALSNSLSDGFKPTLAIIFISLKHERKTICKLLKEEGINVFGATTSGEFIDKDISEGGIVVMLIAIKPECFRIKFYETKDSSALSKAIALGLEGKKIFANPAFIIASGWLHYDGEEIVKGIEQGFGGEPSVFGAMAGDDLMLLEPLVFTQDHESTTGLVALIIDNDRIDVKGIATCGWKPVGITKTITQSDRNIVYTIDDQPALDVVIKYLGLDIDSTSDENVVANLGAYYPLQLERENAPPVMRTAMLGNKQDRSLICAGIVPQGAKVRFSLPPDFDVIDTVVTDCRSLRNEGNQDADVVIMFSCISRYLSFGIVTSEEIDRVMKIWNAPFIGFFSYGEFGKSKGGKHEFHNNTCCVVTLKEIE